MVRAVGLEPTRRKAQDPKSCLATNFNTPAIRRKYKEYSLHYQGFHLPRRPTRLLMAEMVDETLGSDFERACMAAAAPLAEPEAEEVEVWAEAWDVAAAEMAALAAALVMAEVSMLVRVFRLPRTALRLFEFTRF